MRITLSRIGFTFFLLFLVSVLLSEPLLAQEEPSEIRRVTIDDPNRSLVVYDAVGQETVTFVRNGSFFSSKTNQKSTWRAVNIVDGKGEIQTVFVHAGNDHTTKNQDPVVYHSLAKELTSLYAKPGQHYLQSQCSDNGQNCGVAWPDKSTPLTIKDQTFVRWRNPRTNEWEWKSFYQVEMIGNQGTAVRGWIDSDNVQNEKQLLPVATDDCDDPNKNMTDIQKKMKSSAKNQVESVYNQIKDQVGKCLLDKSMELPKSITRDQVNNVADSTVLAHWEKAKTPDVSVNSSQGQKRLSKKDLLAIDTMARTLYGEMAKCQKYGPQYFMTVAAVINNRRLVQHCPYNEAVGPNKTVNDDVKNQGLKRYGRANFKKHKDLRSVSYDVLTRKYGFSLWNQYKGEKSFEPSLSHALCPPANANEKSWQRKKPSQNELDIWREALKTAISAYLHPYSFREKTKEINSYYYTSNADIPGLSEISRKIVVGGRRVNKRHCIQLWHDNGFNSIKYREEQIEKQKITCDEPSLSFL